MNVQPSLRNGSIYTSTARFGGEARAMTEDELRRAAPSVFADTAHESRSERFQPIPTFEIVKALAKEGFSVVGARQSNTRVEGKAPFTKHLLRLRRLEDSALKVGDSVFEMLLKNANDGTAAYDLEAALWRIQCSNSLVSKISSIEQIKVRHSGSAEKVRDNVIEGTFTVLNESQKLLAAPQDWGSVGLSTGARNAFAKAAHVLRFGDPELDEETGKEIKPAIEFEKLLAPRRLDDNGRDLWTTFNVIQENAIKGGLHGVRVTPDEQGRLVNRRRVTTRPVKGIDQDIKLNKALWVLAEELKKAVA